MRGIDRISVIRCVSSQERPGTALLHRSSPPGHPGIGGPDTPVVTPTQAAIAAHGDLIATHELHRLGIGRAGIARMVASGEIVRIRQGWYGNPWLPVPQAQAARVGGQLACGSAAAALGLWSPPLTTLHVCVDSDDVALRHPTRYTQRLGTAAVTVHWTGRDHEGTRTLVSLETCIRQAALCQPAEFTFAVVESGLQRGVLDRATWDRLLADLPRTVRRRLRGAAGRSESGSESVFRYRLAKCGVRARQQVHIPGVGRVDFLIGDRLVVEIDSLAHHSDPAGDRRRDARLSARGYRVLRFMYTQVMDAWPEVEAAVVAAMARGDHEA